MSNLTFRSVMLEAVEVEKQAQGVASGLFLLAQQHGDEWESEVKQAEAWIMSKDAGENRMPEVPRCWTQAASDIRGGIKRGLDPKEYPTYSKFKAAKVELGKSKNKEKDRASNDPRNKDVREKDGSPVTTVEEALESGEVLDAKTTMVIPDDLKQTVEYLSKLPDDIRSKTVDQIERLAKGAHNEYFKTQREHKRGEKPQAVKQRTGTNG